MNAIATGIIASVFLFTTPQFNWFKGLNTRDAIFSVNKSSPLIYNSIIIVPSNDILYGFRVSDGKKLWQTKLNGMIEFFPAVYKDKVYVASEAGYIYIIDYKNGNIIKEITIKNLSITSDFVFGENALFFRTINEELIALNPDEGVILWNYKRKDASRIKIDSVPAPILVGNLVIAGFSDGTVSAVNSESGKEEWNIKLPPAKKFEGIYASPLFFNNTLIIPKYDSGLYAYDIEMKKILWAREEEGYQWCIEYKSNLVCATLSGKIMMLNPFSGNSFWFIDLLKLHRTFPKRKLLSISQPVLVNESLYLTADRRIYSINLSTGNLEWNFSPAGTLFPPGISSRPSVSDNCLAFLTNNGILYTFLLNNRME